MTQKDKDLLFKDLCARLPYGVKVKVKYNDDIWKLLAIYTNGTTYTTRDVGYPIEKCFEDCKPYLFPLSSMSEELKNFIRWKLTTPLHDSFDEDSIEDLLTNSVQVVHFCYEHHLDINGLIPKGIAEDATGKNIY